MVDRKWMINFSTFYTKNSFDNCIILKSNGNHIKVTLVRMMTKIDVDHDLGKNQSFLLTSKYGDRKWFGLLEETAI